ncbi:hypothetical protein TMatcc_003336 [Talaromyces marneffei ATCC 18224]
MEDINKAQSKARYRDRTTGSVFVVGGTNRANDRGENRILSCSTGDRKIKRFMVKGRSQIKAR